MAKNNDGKSGANGGAKDGKAGDNDDAIGQRGNAGDVTDDDQDGKGEGKGDDKPKGKFMTDEEINTIVQRRVSRATKDAEENAKLSKEQLLEKERDDARRDLRVSNARDSFISATKIDYAQGSRLFRMYKDDIEFDDTGKATNIAEVIKIAKSEWPNLFKPEKPGGGDLGSGNGGGDSKPAGGGMNAMLRQRTGRG